MRSFLLGCIVLLAACEYEVGADVTPDAAPDNEHPPMDAGMRDAASQSDAALDPHVDAEADAQTDAAAEPSDASLSDGGNAQEQDAMAALPGLDQRPTNATCLAQETPAALLSETGCFSGSTPSAVLIPYTVASPLWSDGADKFRYLALPEGARINRQTDGDFELPHGAVAIKTFQVGGHPLETRFFVRKSNGDYDAYTYIWRASEDEADLVTDGAKIERDGISWLAPSRDECLKCHTAVAGRTLGLEALQLNVDFSYPSTGRTANQLTTWDAIGMFEKPIDEKLLAKRLVAPSDSSASLEARAKSYLHANCAFCHRPGGLGAGILDLRFGTALPFMRVCEEQPMHGEADVTGAVLLDPGSAQTSVIPLRMRSLATTLRMPAMGSEVVDDLGVEVVEAWIDALSACP